MNCKRNGEHGIRLNHSRGREQRFSVDTDFGIKGIGDSYEHKESQSFSVAGLGAIFLNQVKSFRHLLQLFPEHRTSVVLTRD